MALVLENPRLIYRSQGGADMAPVLENPLLIYGSVKRKICKQNLDVNNEDSYCGHAGYDTMQ
jgi:hypothetical protein